MTFVVISSKQFKEFHHGGAYPATCPLRWLPFHLFSLLCCSGRPLQGSDDSSFNLAAVRLLNALTSDPEVDVREDVRHEFELLGVEPILDSIEGTFGCPVCLGSARLGNRGTLVLVWGVAQRFVGQHSPSPATSE